MGASDAGEVQAPLFHGNLQLAQAEGTKIPAPIVLASHSGISSGPVVVAIVVAAAAVAVAAAVLAPALAAALAVALAAARVEVLE